VKRSKSALHSPGGSNRLHLVASIPGLFFAWLLAALLHTPLPWTFSRSWIPTLDIQLAFHVDGLSAQFLLLITGIGTLVFVYGAGYLSGHPKCRRVLVLLLLFMGAMIGAVVSDHLLVLFVFWELTGILSFMLVGFDHEQETSRKSAQQAVLVTGVGGLCLLAGFILLGQIGGTYSIQKLIERAPMFLSDRRLEAALILVFLGAFTKSAQFPFHFWLPNAMAAPTPVSAYLHSATMVKLGIYLLARLDAAFGNLLFWEYALAGVGTITAVFAATRTIYERDLKRILAWSTVATLGTLVMLVGLPGRGAALATSSLFFAHALYKAPLFFVAGNLDHGTGTREIDRLTGMRHYLPWTATAALLSALSMAGLPLTFGFVAKNAMKLAKAEAETLHLISYATIFVNGISVAVAAIAAVRIFWGRDTEIRQGRPHEAHASMLWPPLILASLGVLFGFAPTLVDPLLGPSALGIQPDVTGVQVKTAYNLLPVLEATLGVLVFGILIYLLWDRLHKLLGRIRHLENWGPEAWYRRSLEFLPKLAARQTRWIQHGLLPGYLLTWITIVSLSIIALLLAAPPVRAWPAVDTLTAPVLGASLLIAVGALTALFVRDHLVLLLVSGLVGYGSAILFLFTGAPDLAFTQFMVETVFVVVVASVLVRLRRMRAIQKAPVKGRLRPVALTVSVIFGGLLTLLALAVSGVPFDSTLTDFYGAQSLLAAHGRNVVNTILVDFRALDTLGEIAVLTFALLAGLPLLKRVRRQRP